jgi:hypothetical protein
VPEITLGRGKEKQKCVSVLLLFIVLKGLGIYGTLTYFIPPLKSLQATAHSIFIYYNLGQRLYIYATQLPNRMRNNKKSAPGQMDEIIKQ